MTRSMIVTGASSGIGASLVRVAASRGWSVLAVARRAERLAQFSPLERVRTLTCDVVAKDAPAKIVSEAVRAFGQIDVIANLAGAAAPGHLLAQTDAQIEHQWQLHVAAPLRLARASLGHILARHGGLVFVGSGLARVPAPGYGAYAPAKAAIRAAAAQLRRELRGDGIFVMYVDPGVVDTEFSVASGMEDQPAWWHGKPEGVAARILAGIERRASRVNASAMHTAGTVFGEWFPGIADAAMATLVTPPKDAAAAPSISASPLEVPPTDFDAAIEPVRRRMERVKLSESFVHDLLQPEARIELNETAMRWAGMPNKNERAALSEVLEALARAGFLEQEDDEHYRVLRAP